MEEKEKDEIIPINDDAPPVLIPPNQNLNSNNNNNSNKNINNKDILNMNKQVIVNKNIIKSQNPVLYMNPYLLTRQIYFPYNPYNTMQLNYNNQIKEKNKIELNKSLNNNKNSINNDNNIDEQINNSSDYYDLNLDINPEMLNNLDKNLLIDIICFIRYACKIKISSKFTHLSNGNFKISQNKNKINEYSFNIRKNLYKLFLDQLNQKEIGDNFNIINNNDNNNDIKSDSNSDNEEEDEENKIINEEYIINKNNNRIKIEKYKHIPEIFFCELHNKLYLDKNQEWHFNRHKKCIKCGEEFTSKIKRQIHMNTVHKEIIINNNNKNNIEIIKQNLNQEINEDKIKCTECEKYFDSVELMSAHFYDEHEMKKIGKNNIKINEENEDFKEENENKIQEEEEIKRQIKNIKYYSNYYHGKNIIRPLNEVKNRLKIKSQFYCDVCNRYFKDKMAIFQHRRDKGH